MILIGMNVDFMNTYICITTSSEITLSLEVGAYSASAATFIKSVVKDYLIYLQKNGDN